MSDTTIKLDLHRNHKAMHRPISVYSRALAELERLERNLEMANGCLGMIREDLAALGCCHGHDSSATPPMMYNDWIRCVVAKRERVDAALVTAARIAEGLLLAYLADGKFPKGSDCDEVASILRDALALDERTEENTDG